MTNLVYKLVKSDRDIYSLISKSLLTIITKQYFSKCKKIIKKSGKNKNDKTDIEMIFSFLNIYGTLSKNKMSYLFFSANVHRFSNQAVFL